MPSARAAHAAGVSRCSGVLCPLLARLACWETPYLTDGTLEDLETDGRKRLLPHLAHLPLGEITERHVRDWIIEMTEQHQAGAISAKTINNARAALSSVLGDAVRWDLLPRNPCRFVGPLPIEHRELAYLRVSEIDPSCARASALPTTRRAAHRHWRAHLRSARPHLARIDLDHRTCNPTPTRTPRQQHHPDQGQPCSHRANRPAPQRRCASCMEFPRFRGHLI